MEELAVIKYGGHAMTDEPLAEAFFADLSTLIRQNYSCILVHGGGPQINSLLKRLQIESQFVKGLRKTDAATLEAVEMVLSGSVNKDLVAKLAKVQVLALGLSGRDANLLSCEALDPDLGRVGKITKVDPYILKTLLQAKITPVVAPLANDKNQQAYNVNADTAASAIASELKASYFVLISDVQGVLDQEQKVMPQIKASQVKTLIAKDVITGGMIPKVESCLNALNYGAKSALILDGTKPHSLRRFLLDHEPLGTLVTCN
ncbi:MAG: acetylglutamate kinase [Desulfovibrionaceae bacterium]|nr:acetylglutamate kinase [Desulfovibrionaceae bacterium]